MATITSLAAEFNAQPYEVAAFADLGNMAEDAELDADTEAMIREAWAQTGDYVTTAEMNRREERVLDEVAEILDRAGYDDEIA